MARNVECGGLAAAFEAETTPKQCQNTKNISPRVLLSWKSYSRLFQFLLRDPLIGSSLQHVERQRSTIEHLIVKPANVELAS